MSEKIWNGINLDYWAQTQTMRPMPRSWAERYAGPINLSMPWWDYIPAIPLDLRFSNFKERLERVLGK